MSWAKAFRNHPAGHFVVGEKFTIYDREHTIIEVQEARGVAYVKFDGQSNRPEPPRGRIITGASPRH
jgi:hypothetical protein